MRNVAEHLIFAALLIPTLVLVSAAAISLAPLDTSVATPAPISMFTEHDVEL